MFLPGGNELKGAYFGFLESGLVIGRLVFWFCPCLLVGWFIRMGGLEIMFVLSRWIHR